jgi:hypothetical protein
VFSDDNLKVTLTSTGLLAKVELTTEDKTGQVIVKLAELAKEALKLASGAPVPFAAGAKPPFNISLVIDPTVPAERAGVTSALKPFDCDLVVELEPVNAITLTHNREAVEREGIFVRPGQPYVLRFKSPDGVTASTIVELPNDAPIFSLELARAAFVRKTQTVELENGMLKKVEIDLPSSALAFINIPVEVAKTLVSIPSEVFKFRADVKTTQKNDIDADRAVLESKKQLLEAQEAYRKALEERKTP